ncbi:MAG TPA: hypothetical protein VFO94_01105 [Gammaproteobacteria bacterium]|nr:hypothetical protein [Gammaproteobacteria bacterium]
MSERKVLVVSLWLRAGVAAAALEAFERRVAKIQARHGGRIERAIRTGDASASAPFEVHVVSFPDDASLAAYRADPEIRALAELRASLIARTEIVEGVDVPVY